ncbi:MAG: Ig-like domain-containing domain [Pirellulaceae bacterium]
MIRVLAAIGCLMVAGVLWAEDAPAARNRPAAMTMAELVQMEFDGVAVREVSDYVFGGYEGDLPSPPHADLNPKKAFVIRWKDFPYRFVFAHEASYCPWFELPSGAAVCYQFFEGNLGWAELFNNWGRQERNSFVDILESGPQRVWVRWTYFGVNMEHGQPAYRGTEDFWAYPNGLLLRRQTFDSLLPGEHRGYAREPMELIGLSPVGKRWSDVLRRMPGSEERHALAVLDAFSDKRYDVFWTPTPGTVWDSTHRRSGCVWQDLDDSAGVVMAVPLSDGTPFCSFGDNSGFQHDYTRLKDLTFESEAWGSVCWDHWPIGWLNSQAHVVDSESWKRYPNHFSPLGMDLFALSDEEAVQGVYYSLLGVSGDDWEVTRRSVRQWLEKGTAALADPASGADLPVVWTPHILVQQPQDAIVRAGRGATLSVVTADVPSLAYQWQRANPGTSTYQDIAGAKGPDYTTEPLAGTADGVKFRCILTLPESTLTSLSATVHVDDAIPQLVSARVPLDRADRIVVAFSEPVVAPASATNFALDHGVEVTGVLAGAAPHQLELATTPLTPGQSYTLTVHRIFDRVGHETAPNASCPVDFTPLLPLDCGQIVCGFQDDFNGEMRDPHWVAVPAQRDCYTQAEGVLQVTTMDTNPSHLLYAAAGYDHAVQEVLARIRIKQIALGAHPTAGISVACSPETAHAGEAINFIFLQDPGDTLGVSGPVLRLVDDWRAWGPAVPEFTWATDNWYWMRLSQTVSSAAHDANIHAKVWRADGTEPEPATWQVEWARADRTGLAGIRGPHDGGPTAFEVDYILIKAEGLPRIQVAPAAVK